MITFGERAAQYFGAVASLLGWRPSEFWDSTPAELAGALSTACPNETVERTDIERLRAQFPDTCHG